MSARAVAVIRPAPIIFALLAFLFILSGQRQLHASGDNQFSWPTTLASYLQDCSARLLLEAVLFLEIANPVVMAPGMADRSRNFLNTDGANMRHVFLGDECRQECHQTCVSSINGPIKNGTSPIEQQDKFTALRQSEDDLTEELIVVGKRADRSICHSWLKKAELLKLFPIGAANSLEVARRRGSSRVGTTAIAVFKDRAATKILFHELCFNEQRRRRLPLQDQVDGCGLTLSLFEHEAVFSF